MRRIFPLAMLLALVVPASLRAEPVDLELALAADGSGSIDDEELQLQRDGYADAISHPSVLAAIRSGYIGAIAITYIEWGGPDSQHTIVDWAVIGDAEAAEAFAEKLRTRPRQAIGYNSISNVVAYATEKILTNAHEGTRKVIDVSGDGPQIGGRPLATVRAETIAAGITINAIAIDAPGGHVSGPGGMALDRHYRQDVIGGPGAFVMVAEDRLHFRQAILQKMLLEIAEADPSPARLAAAGALPAAPR